MAKIICFYTKTVLADLPSIDYGKMDRVALITEFGKYPELSLVPYALAQALFMVAKTDEERSLCIRRMEMVS
jgi:hypothetical protein